MSIILSLKRSFLAMSFALPLLAAVPAQAQGDGPLSTCLEQSGREAEAFKTCLIQHQEELRALDDLPANWATRVLAHLQSHPEAWDRLENTRDRAENVRDRHEDRLNTREDQRDDQVDLEDVFEPREDVRDRAEDRVDRREGVRARTENRRDPRH